MKIVMEKGCNLIANVKIIILLFCSAIFINCKSDKKPDNLLSEEKMIALLTEVTIYHSYKSYNSQNDTIILPYKIDHIYKKYGLDSVQFHKQLAYYQTDIEKYSSLYKAVQNNIQQRIEETTKLPNDEEIKMESREVSINKINEVSTISR